MKQILLMIAVVALVGCGSLPEMITANDIRYAGPEGQARRQLEKRVRGTYEAKVNDDTTIRWIIGRMAGMAEEYNNGIKTKDLTTWTVIDPASGPRWPPGPPAFDPKKLEIYIKPFPDHRNKPIVVFRINPDDSITRIGEIHRSKQGNTTLRADVGNDKQITFKKIKEPPPQPEPKAAANKPEPPKVEPKAAAKKLIPPKAFTNTLGMKFVPVKGTEVAFCIWETRVKDYAAYAAANAGVDGRWKKPGFFPRQADTHPVVKVSWKDAQAFCAWLTKKEMAEGKIKAGQKYRLPTDAEWSVAVGLGKEKGNTPKEKQMGIKGVYPWGNQWPPPVGAGNYDEDLKVDNFEYTSPAGSFAANKLGLHDMGGNVWEWCEDWYDPAAKADRVLRGAHWGLSNPDRLLSSYRYYATPDYRDGGFGFRCVLVGGSGG